VWVLWGDSNAASWIPSLSQIAKFERARLAVFVFPGCSSLLDGTNVGRLVTEKDCQRYHSVLPDVVAKLKPVKLISASLGMGFSGKQADIAAFAASWKSSFDQLVGRRTGVIKVLMGTTPNRAGLSIAGCLATSQQKTILQCSPRFFSGAWYGTNYWSYLQRDVASAGLAGAKLVPVESLFCDVSLHPTRPNYCPAIVGQNLVQVDADHISTAYMQYITPALLEIWKSVGL
jgi:hypothetical protein